jgi:hypothetical protein
MITVNDIHPDNTQEAPTVLLMHGAFAESASWNGVIAELQQHGRRVAAVANPLRACSTMPPTCAA